MYKDDVASILGAIISTLIAGLSFIYNLGVLQVLFPFLAGAFTTYVIQHRLQLESENREIKRQNYDLMRERIYGPLLKQTSQLVDSLRSFEKYVVVEGTENWTQIEREHLFYSVSRNLKHEYLALSDQYAKYQSMRFCAELALDRIIRKEGEHLLKKDIDPSVVFIKVLIEETQFASLSLERGVFLGISPKDFVREQTAEWGTSIPFNIDCSFVDRPRALDTYELLYTNVRNQIEKHPLFVAEKNQRMRLLQQLEDFSQKLRPLVNLS
jgi:hypothetical protein